MQFGPISRIPPCDKRAVNSPWRRWPSGPVSANPPRYHQRFDAFASAPAATSITCSAAQHDLARSTGPGIASIVDRRNRLNHAGRRVNRIDGPIESIAQRLWKISPPIVPRFREAPITATAADENSFQGTDAAPASRCSKRSIASRVNVVGKVREVAGIALTSMENLILGIRGAWHDWKR